MAIPNVSGALRGWTKRQTVRVITKAVLNFVIQQTAIVYTFDINVQPLQPEKVNRKPEEQRAWKWFSITTKASNPILEIDSQIVVNGISYRIDSINDWSDAGFRHYEATQDYAGNDPMYSVIYNGNGSDGGTVPKTVAYQTGAQPTSATNTFTRTGYAFTSWNTSADGSGTTYLPGTTLTIASADITLYAQWV